MQVFRFLACMCLLFCGQVFANPAEKGELQVELAVAYARDQELEKAFKIYLDALKHAHIKKAPNISEEEGRLFKEASEIYLSQQGPAASKAAKNIRADYDPVMQRNPDYYLLGFIVSAAYANQQHFDDFFLLFYQSYQRYPEHYLAYKTKALLNIKLWQRGRTPEERDVYRCEVKRNAEVAIKLNPQDASIYKMALDFANEEEKREVVELCLNNIVQRNIIIPREDVIHFVQAAVSSGHRALAQALINNARDWYPHSRAIENAQRIVDSAH